MIFEAPVTLVLAGALEGALAGAQIEIGRGAPPFRGSVVVIFRDAQGARTSTALMSPESAMRLAEGLIIYAKGELDDAVQAPLDAEREENRA
jgi:hypothetical protein